MSIIPEVKCRRCGESFSALRSRCPNCGTRRVSQSSRTPDTTPSTVRGTASYERASANTRWQLIFGLILVVAVILAVIVMVSTGLNDDGSGGGRGRTAATTPTPEISLAPTPEAAPTPSPTPTPTIQKIEIRYVLDGKEKPEITMRIGEKVPLEAIIIPTDIAGTITWTTDNPDLISITVDPENPNRCTLECLALQPGGIKIHAECYGVTQDCQVYMRES